MSSVEHLLHFGLPENVDNIDSLIVHWPGNTQTKLKNIELNQTLSIEYDNYTKSKNNFILSFMRHIFSGKYYYKCSSFFLRT